MLYPIAVKLEGRRCLVVGAGAVAHRKVQALIAASATITVVAPEAAASIRQWHTDGHLQLILRRFEPCDVAGMTLVFACTTSAEVNTTIVAAARGAGALASRADDADDCDFMGMSRVDRGHLLLAISTGGESPAVARWMREELAARIGPEYGSFLDLLASLRGEVKRSLPPAERAAAWERAIRSDAFRLLNARDAEGALGCLRAALGLPGPV